jgi:DNA-binding winged helix-turn-helix (wHTH) protein
MLYSFDDYTLDAERYELVQSGGLLPVEPQVLDVLAYLLQHHGGTVTTEELLAQLYPHQDGTDDRLTNAMVRVREGRHDAGRTQRHIQTVHRWGYRFAASVTAHPPGMANLPAASTPDMPWPQATSDQDQAHAVSPLTPGPSASPSASIPGPPPVPLPTATTSHRGQRRQDPLSAGGHEGAAADSCLPEGRWARRGFGRALLSSREEHVSGELRQPLHPLWANQDVVRWTSRMCRSSWHAAIFRPQEFQ